MREHAVWMCLCQPACLGCLIPSHPAVSTRADRPPRQGNLVSWAPVGFADGISSLYHKLAVFSREGLFSSKTARRPLFQGDQWPVG